MRLTSCPIMRPTFGAWRSPQLMIDSGDTPSTSMPAAIFVTKESPSTSAPICRAAMPSSALDMPTRSAPIVRNIWISAGVSNCGPWTWA